MSNLSIFDKKWLDVVFDGKNKEYGAYQLRQETQKTSLRAFAFGTMIVLSCIGIFTLSSFFSADKVVIDEPTGTTVILTDINLPDKVIIPEIEEPKVKTERVFSDDVVLKNPIVAVATVVTQTIAPNTNIGKTTNDPNINNGTTKPENPVTGGNTVVAVPEVKVPNNKIVDRKALDEQPSFPGGIQKFYTYVGNNFEKPELNEETTITVKVSFIVEKDGSMSNIKVLEDPGYGLGQEAIRVLKSLKTDWNPGILDGEPVRTFYNLPITVKLE
jgi:periplasmic protein TonB